jgi:fructokinase
MAPEKIVFEGSVLQESDMPKVREYFKQFNNGCVATPDLEELIVRPSIKNNGSATIDNFGLALKALKE